MNTRIASCSIILATVLTSAVSAQEHTKRGAIFGGLAGAAAGAAIGDHNDEAGAGALIGAAIGTITGAAIGNTVDEDHARQRAAAAYRQQAQLSRAVSPQDVVFMTRNGLSDQVIINHIRSNGVQRRVEVADVIALHNQGVSELVITTMQQAPVGGYSYPSAPVRAPVIVRERYVPAPVYVHPVRRYPSYHHHYDRYHHYDRHHHHRHYPSSGFSFHLHK